MTDEALPAAPAKQPPSKARSPFAVQFSARDLLNVAIFAVRAQSDYPAAEP